MAIINNLNTSNTFAQWLTTTQSVVTKFNQLTDGGDSLTFLANTNVEFSNNVTITGNLIVGGNITLDSVGFDDLIVNGSANIANTLSVTGNTTLSNATISYGNFTTSNIIFLTGSANTAIYANIAAAATTASGDALAFAIALG